MKKMPSYHLVYIFQERRGTVKRIYQGHLAVILLLTIGTLLVMGLSSAENSSAKEGSVYYTCPMTEHADVVMDKPGKCPKCGMKLVPKEMGK